MNNRIFITEIKWEESKTLAASKLYSFLGKVNSKIDGTLGLFISYNELSTNFINSVRSGIKQNCIIINGEDSIVPIIKGDVSLKDYIWYIYQQASTRNRIFIPVSEFMSLPRKSGSKKIDSKWNEVYNALISDEGDGVFEIKLESNYHEIDLLPEKTITLYPILNKNKIIENKLNYLVDSIIDNEKNAFYQSLIAKLKSLHWLKYADESLLNKSKSLSKPTPEQADSIANKVLEYLREHYGQWEEENKASLVLDFLFKHLSQQVKDDIYCAYAEIYCDESRRDHYPQKEFAQKLFSELNAKDKFKVIKKEIKELISQYKDDEKIFSDETEDENKKYVVRRIKQKFTKLFDESGLDNINSKLEKMYDNA